MRTLLIALLAIFVLASCSSGGGDSASTQSTEATGAVTTTPEETQPATETTAEVAKAPILTGEVELAGKLGCGHCTHGIGEACSAAVQTADGAIYILQDMAAGTEPFDQRYDGKDIVVNGTSVELDGVGYVTVTGFQL